MLAPDSRGNNWKRYSRLLFFILIIAMLIIVCVLFFCFVKTPQNYPSAEDDDSGMGINVNTQDTINPLVLENLPEYDFGGGLIAIVLCIAAFGLFVKYKRK